MAYARVHLGMKPREFWELTPVEWHALIEAHAQKQKDLIEVIAVIINGKQVKQLG